MMTAYDIQAEKELKAWQKKMLSRPSLFNKLSKKITNQNQRMDT